MDIYYYDDIDFRIALQRKQFLLEGQNMIFIIIIIIEEFVLYYGSTVLCWILQ
jgi:hypothetical protein